jgi:sec-independent protein translocase protein TatC
MYLLKKIIQIRENSHPDHEKPFLEHLEDLRIMVTRIVITLLISMMVCFIFQKKLMDVLRLPVERMWVQQIEDQLPREKEGVVKPVDVDLWEKAKQVERAASGLSGGERDRFYATLDPDHAFHAQSVALLRAALALPEDSRAAFLDSLDVSAGLKKQVRALLHSAPSPEMDSRGNLRLMSALRPTETFMLSMKLSFFAGIVVSFPLLLMYVLQFVLPGLHSHERRMMWPALLVGFGLFLCGVFFAYFVVLPRALDFFYGWSGSLGVSNDWRIGEYISFATRFTLLFGLSFELPVVVMVLVKLGLLSYETMSNSRSYAVLAIFVTAAILTPTPDAFTLILMALPMLVLYEICIWLAWFDARRSRVADETEAREREERMLIDGGPATVVEEAAGGSGHCDDDVRADDAGDDGYSDAYEQQEFDEFPEYPSYDEPGGQDGPAHGDDSGEKPS